MENKQHEPIDETQNNTCTTDNAQQESPSENGNCTANETDTCACDNEDTSPAEETLESQLQQAEAEIAELKDKLLRQAADFANFRKHSIATQTDLILNGGKKVLEALLPILDDMERAEKNLASATDLQTLQEGLQLIFQKLQRTLEQQGLQRMDTTNASFNTDYHEAIALLPVEEEEQKNKVIDCVQTGYMLNDKVLRHAKVAVGQ